MRMTSCWSSFSLVLLAACAAGEDQPVAAEPMVAEVKPVVPGVPVSPPASSNWTRKGVVGLYLTNTVTDNADTSHDASIGGSSTSTTVDGKADVAAEWREGKNSVEHTIKAEYARSRQQNAEWLKTKDELRYDGIYRRELKQPHFVYGSWGFETVFQGPPPTYDAFQPFLGKVGAGYGQLYENLLPEKDRLEWRIGARAQKRWGRYLTDDEGHIETGPDAFARYERQAIINRNGQDLRYFLQYEGFSEFNDLAHITNLITAGLTYKLTGNLTIDLAFRAYYETRPKEDRATHELAGYNQWSMRQDTLLGLAYTL